MKKPVVLVIMDGLGHCDEGAGNAVCLAKKPFLDKMWDKYPTIFMRASEKWVGLPKGQMGNSEVGHLNIGAGRIVFQSLVRINNAIKENSLKDLENIKAAIKHAKDNNSKLHILGLVSDGGVHAHSKHIIALDKISKAEGVDTYVHAYTDGRDVEPTSADRFIKELTDEKVNIASISGRYFSMDRDKNFDRTMKSYDVSVKNEGNSYEDIQEYIKSEKEAGRNDEFILPAYDSTKSVKIEKNDAIIFANFRPDRARQLSHLFVASKVYDFDKVEKIENIFFASMMEYANIPTNVIFEPMVMKNLLGETLSKAGKKQMRAAETEKYPHVTFFMDGGKEIDLEGEIKILAKSPAVATYDLQPEMSAPELTEKIIKEIGNVDVALINYANPDMVGHSGSIEATTKAVEVVNDMVEKLYDKVVNELGGVMLLTADHGNAETMLDKNDNPWTAHTIVPVKFCITSNEVEFKDEYKESDDIAKLGDIAPTILKLAGVEVPEEMTGSILLK